MDANIVNRFWHNALQRQQSLTSHTHTVLSSNHNTCTDHCEFVHDLNVQTWSYLPSIADITAILDSLIPCVTHCQEDRDWVDSASGNWTRVSLYQMSHILTCLTIKHHNMSLTKRNFIRVLVIQTLRRSFLSHPTDSSKSTTAFFKCAAINILGTYTHGSCVPTHMGHGYIDTWVMCT